MDFASERIIKHSATNYSVSYGDDSSVIVEFFSEPVLQPAESEKEGRPIYKEVPFISIDFPGDKTKRVVRPVRTESNGSAPADTDRFPRQWEAFKNQQEFVATGTPITEWPPIVKAQAMELKGMKIYTVEALAGLPDTALSWFGARQLRDKAKTWLETAKTGSLSTEFMAEFEKMKADNAVMRQQMADLSAREENDSPRRGRPPKQPQE